MDIEQRQAELIYHFVKQASNQKGSALGPVIIEATSQPWLFAFSEILAVPSVTEVWPKSSLIQSISCNFFRFDNCKFYFVLVCFMGLTKEFVQLEGTENSAYLDLLRLFAHGTWSDYKSKCTEFCFWNSFSSLFAVN